MAARRGGEGGQVLVLAALFMFVLLGAAALAVDYGSWLSARRDFQGVADAASLAGAGQLPPPGEAPPTSTEQTNAGVAALVYLNDHLGWGHDQAWAAGQVGAALNQQTPLTVSAGSGTYCVWIWTATPAANITTTGSASCQAHPGDTLYAPANYPADIRKVFVRIESPRRGYFGGVLGITGTTISAIAVAGGSRNNYAVIALKPRLNTPDNYDGVTITGSSILKVDKGDVGGNYTIAWGGTYSHIVFPYGTDQAVVIAEPQSVSGIGTVTGGIGIQPLIDYPIPDPAYGTPSPCSGALTDPCWTAYPPSTGGTTGKGVYPACATAQDINKHSINCADGSTITIYPGRYEQVSIPAGTTATLSPTCYPGDACNPGVFYFRLDGRSNGGGLYVNGTPGSPTTVTGCGVLLIFDPNESGGSGIQMNVSGNGNTININATSCGMKSSPTNPGGTTPYLWYGYGAADFTNPISVWVRPNGLGYNVTTPGGGSNVIAMGAGSTINENGVIYAPEDNTKISGGPLGSGVGQIVSWTITYTGGTFVSESFQGPAMIRTRLYQ